MIIVMENSIPFNMLSFLKLELYGVEVARPWEMLMRMTENQLHVEQKSVTKMHWIPMDTL